MSLQDKIFDVAAVLDGRAEEALFDEIIIYLGHLEEELDKYRKFYYSVQALKQSFEDIENNG
jgi:hypothetical protein